MATKSSYTDLTAVELGADIEPGADIELGQSPKDSHETRVRIRRTPEILLRMPEVDQEYGVFGKHAVIWRLTRTKEIGLCKGKPRAAARLIVLKNPFDTSERKLLLKRLPYRNEKRLKRFWMEIETHRHVSHFCGSDYICNFYGVRNCVSHWSTGRPAEGKLDYVMELGSGGDILSFVQAQWKEFSKLKSRTEQSAFLANHVASTQRIIAQIAFAVKQCFEAKIVHFDLKLENVVMTKILDDSRVRYMNKMFVNGRKFDWCVKLIDFGLARHFPGNNWVYKEGRKGTPRYMAPEIATGSRHIDNSRNADIWPIGVMLWECLAGLPLWKEARPSVSTYREMVKSGSFRRWFKNLCTKRENRHFGHFVPPDAVDLMNNIFRPDPTKRLNIEQILNHVFLKHQKPDPAGSLPEDTESEEVKIETNNSSDLMKPKWQDPQSKLQVISNLKQNEVDEDESWSEASALTGQKAGEQLPNAIKRKQNMRARCIAIWDWICVWGIYTGLILGYVVGCPFWVQASGLWDWHAYWSVFLSLLPLVLGLFFYHMRRGLKASKEQVFVSERSKFTSSLSTTIWNVGWKPLITVLSQLSTLAFSLMWIENGSWVHDDDNTGKRFRTTVNGQRTLILLIAHAVLSAVFFYLRAKEFEQEDSAQIFFSQLIGIRIFWDVETASKIRRQTAAIREHKIVEGIVNAFLTFYVVSYYYFEMSIGVSGSYYDVVREISWVGFSVMISLLSISLVLNMGDTVGISIDKVGCQKALYETTFIIFRMADVSLRVGALAVFAACVSATYSAVIFFAELFIFCLLSYVGIINLNTNRFDFVHDAGIVHRTIKTFFSSCYGCIACPLLQQGKYYYPLKIIHDGFLIFAAWYWTGDNITVWEKPHSYYALFTVIGLFFVFGFSTFWLFDWKQYHQILSVRDNAEDEDVVATIVEICKPKPALLNRFLVSGILRVSTVRELALKNWGEYEKTREWLRSNGFYDLPGDAESLLARSTTVSTWDGSHRNTWKFKKVNSERKGPRDLHFNPHDDKRFDVPLSTDLASRSTGAKCLCMALSPDGLYLAVGLEDSPFLMVLDLPSLNTVMDLRCADYQGAVRGVEFRTPKIGQIQLMTVSEDAKLRIYEPLSGPHVTNKFSICGITSKIEKVTYNIRCLAAEQSKSSCAVGVGSDIWMVDIKSLKSSTLKGHTDDVTAIKFFPNNPSKFVTGSCDKSVKIWNTKNRGKTAVEPVTLDFGMWDIKYQPNVITTVDVNFDGTAVACGSINGMVMVWEKSSMDTWVPAARIRMTAWVDKVDFLPKKYKNFLLIHTRPQKTTASMIGDKKWMANGYTAVWDYHHGSCYLALVQENLGISSSCVLEIKGRLKLVTGSWSSKDQHFLVMWDLDKHLHEIVN